MKIKKCCLIFKFYITEKKALLCLPYVFNAAQVPNRSTRKDSPIGNYFYEYIKVNVPKNLDD